MKRILLAASLIAGTAFSASAADVYTPGGLKDTFTEDRVEAHWSGIWVGALGGYQFSNSKLDFDYDDVPAPGEKWAETIDAYVNGLGMDGFLGETQVGYDQQVSDRLLLGIFAGYGINNAEFEAGYSHTFDGKPGFLGSESLSGSQEWHGVLGARIGVIKSPDTMFYGAGGWAFGKLDAISLTDNKGVTKEFTPEEDDLSGWFLELGAEHRLKDNIYGTFSGRYTQYGANTIVSGDDCRFSGDTDACSYSLDVEKKDFAIMLGLKAKLGVQ